MADETSAMARLMMKLTMSRKSIRSPSAVKRLKITIVTLVSAVVLTACANLVSVTPEQEMKIGASNHPKIIKEYGGVYNNPAVKAYVEAIMVRIAKSSDKPDMRYRITVLDTPTVNAFALPGGYTYVTRGLVALANSEAELAGVIGHEIAHVTARHGVKRQSTQQSAAVLAGVLGAAINAGTGLDVGVATDLARLGSGAVLAGYSREQEYEADNLGIQAMSRAGYDPMAQADFLGSLGRYAEVMSGTKGKTSSGWFNSHPNNKDRVAKAREKATARKLPTSTDVGVARHLAVIDGMLYGQGVEHGIVDGRSFAHPGLKLQFKVPVGFEIRNFPDKVTATHENDMEIIFDVVARPKGLGMREYLGDIWAAQANAADVKEVTVQGQRAAIGKVETQNGTAHLLAIAYGTDRIFRFGVLAASSQTANAETAFDSLRRNIKFLSSAAANAIKPLRVSVITVQPEDTIDSLASMMAGTHSRKALFMVMNGLKEGDQIVAGQRLKLVVN